MKFKHNSRAWFIANVAIYKVAYVQEIWCDLRSSGVLRSVEWYSFTAVSGKHIGPIDKVQVLQKISDLINIATEAWNQEMWYIASSKI
jgi:hypothetical protein